MLGFAVRVVLLFTIALIIVFNSQQCIVIFLLIIMLQKDAVKSEDVPMEILRRRLELVSSKQEAEDILRQLNDIKQVGGDILPVGW